MRGSGGASCSEVYWTSGIDGTDVVSGCVSWVVAFWVSEKL